ncbi:YcnI family protein [Aquihabitans daechungensis]|uniref:YcnI family copper-binding membrane protein n=1 Tax=Aquihabitans daechungensis TaxID=1052257 RepID=UPI003BA0E1C7
MRSIRFTLVAVAAAAAAVVLSAVPASAHITIPEPGTKGGFSIVTFSVPNERDDSSTTKIEVQLPKDHPLAFVSVQPKPGWEVETTKRTLDEPIEAFGETYDEVVDTVTWSGGEIGAGEFDTFSLSVGPLPEDVDSLTFPAIQTYRGGEEVSWIEPTPEGGEEPEHPAPTLALVAGAEEGHHAAGDEATTTVASSDSASSASTSADDDDDEDEGTDGVAVAALVLAGVAVVLGGAALVSSRRRSGDA